MREEHKRGTGEARVRKESENVKSTRGTQAEHGRSVNARVRNTKGDRAREEHEGRTSTRGECM